MKNKIIVLVLMVFSIGFVNAQEKKMEMKKDKGEMLEKMKEKLGLSDQQVNQIKAIDAKYENEESDIRERMHKVKEEHRALRDKKKAEINKILTEEQREKIQEWKKERKDKKWGDHKEHKTK